MQHNKVRATEREKLSDWLAGYIAGMVDGEGTITVSRNKDLRIYNNNLAMLSVIQVFAGGKISPNGTPPGLVLSFRLEEKKWLLPQIIPYLIIKKQKAMDLLKIL